MSMSLHEALAERGLYAAEKTGLYARVIRDAGGREVFRGDAGAVWAWLRKGKRT